MHVDIVGPDHDGHRRSFTTSRRWSDWSRRQSDWTTERIFWCSSAAKLGCAARNDGLEWRDVDLEKRQLSVERSDWKGQVTSTKGGRVRHVPTTVRLAGALRAHRHLRGARVLCQDNAAPLTQKIVQDHVRRAARV